MNKSALPLFWRHQDLPFIELRRVLDGSKVSYTPHSHQEWSIGAILEGRSDFLCEGRQHDVAKGDLVIMNPTAVHACNPKPDSNWAYYMMHVDVKWLVRLLYDKGILDQEQWQPTCVDTLSDTGFYNDFVDLCELIFRLDASLADKQQAIEGCLLALFSHLPGLSDLHLKQVERNRLYDVADYLNDHCLDDTPIEKISAHFAYNTSYLIRAFKRHFNMTPHAYRLNRRVQLGQAAIKQGEPIVQIAQSLGFSDQAHFQRVFKQRVAATPGQYKETQRN
ncbi:AraC family transcriptional regulator [Marinomonas epiphytica]